MHIRLSETYYTLGKSSWTFWESKKLLKIIQKYFEAYQEFQDLSNFKKYILAIKDNFTNHKKYFEACQTFKDLLHLRKVILDLLAIQKTFKIIETYYEAYQIFQDLLHFRKIILGLLAIQKAFKNHRKIF